MLGRGGAEEDSIQQHHNRVVVVEERGNPAGLRQAPRERRRTWERGRAAPELRLKLPCVSPLYIGVEGLVSCPPSPLGRWPRWEERNLIISFPTDCYPPFLGILILSLRDMILFLLRGDLGAP